MFRRLLPLVALCCVAALSVARSAGAGAPAASSVRRATADPPRPRLAVILVIDQFRADYLTRFADLYLPARNGNRIGGFRFLQSRGAWYPDCRYDHHRTVTGVGHAILATGAQPAVNGIVGNSWWDRATGRAVYCVSDPKTQTVGPASAGDAPMSPANLLATTVADELELATGGRARTVSLSLKDRAAILLSGHRVDQAVWFSDDTGNWISSRYYCPDGKLPAWAEAMNARRLPDTLRREPWTPSVSAEALQRVWSPKGAPAPFSHPLGGRSYGAFATSPAGNAFLFATAREAVVAEQLGQDAIPDLLTLNLASNDYVGHRFGPDSAEVLDISVQTDRQLADFLAFLDRTVPGGLQNVTFALSADHGVATAPEIGAAAGVPVARAVASAIRQAAERALDEAVAPEDWIASLENGEIYFRDAALASHPKESRARLEEIVAEAVRAVPGVYLALGKTAILSGRVPANRLGRQVTEGLHPARSGDVVVLLHPGWLAGAAPVGTGSSHGAPFPYDSHVPLLLFGFGVKPGVYGRPVTPAMLAPTLAHLLGVARPSAADAPLLPGLVGVEP